MKEAGRFDPPPHRRHPLRPFELPVRSDRFFDHVEQVLEALSGAAPKKDSRVTIF